MEEQKESLGNESLQKEKKPRSKAQLEAFEKAKEKRLESLKVKNERITEKKEEINEIKKLKPKDVLTGNQDVKPPAKPIKKTPVKEESESEEEEEIIVVKKAHKKKPKKKVIYLDDSDTESEEEEVIIKKKPHQRQEVQSVVKATPPAVKHRQADRTDSLRKPEIIQPVNPQYMLRFV